MNAAMPAPSIDPVDEVNLRLSDLRSRYETLLDHAGTPDRKASVAHLGVKIHELCAASRAHALPERDAAGLPGLAVWLHGRITALEAQYQSEAPGFRLVVRLEDRRAVA